MVRDDPSYVTAGISAKSVGTKLRFYRIHLVVATGVPADPSPLVPALGFNKRKVVPCMTRIHMSGLKIGGAIGAVWPACRAEGDEVIHLDARLCEGHSSRCRPIMFWTIRSAGIITMQSLR